jgi:hypothetical protein
LGKESIYFDRSTSQFLGTKEAIKQLHDTYKGIDVTCELNKMALWLNSSKGLRRKGNIAFIMNWLNNATPSTAIAERTDPIDTTLEPIMNDYRKDLWKEREHILEFNTFRRQKKKSIFD